MTCQDVRKSKKVELEKPDAGANEISKPSHDMLHIAENLDTPAAPVIIAGETFGTQAAGVDLSYKNVSTGRRFFYN